MSGRFVSEQNNSAARKPRNGPAMKVTALRHASLQASERRVAEKRERRHREQAVQAWLRSLDRA
jgi:hypothetical protein